MKEIGSFIEFDLRETGEFYQGEKDIAHLNTARASIFHCLRLMKCDTIYLPYYLCPTVKNFLARKGINLTFYYINRDFEPFLNNQKKAQQFL